MDKSHGLLNFQYCLKQARSLLKIYVELSVSVCASHHCILFLIMDSDANVTVVKNYSSCVVANRIRFYDEE